MPAHCAFFSYQPKIKQLPYPKSVDSGGWSVCPPAAFEEAEYPPTSLSHIHTCFSHAEGCFFLQSVSLDWTQQSTDKNLFQLVQNPLWMLFWDGPWTWINQNNPRGSVAAPV